FVYSGYWAQRYFFKNLSVGGRRVVFTGSFGDFMLKAIGLGLLSLITFGLAYPYFIYWSYKYFASHIELGGEEAALSGFEYESSRPAYAPVAASPAPALSAPSPEPSAPTLEPSVPALEPSVSRATPQEAPSEQGRAATGASKEEGPPRYQFGSP
ncbi:MAG: DUF898 family protein, partial [Bacteroidota bacterium]